MPKIRWPIRSASVGRIFSGAAFLAQALGERLDQPVHAFGRLERNRSAVGACLLLVELGDSGLSNRSGSKTVCGTLSVVTQGPPFGQNACR